MKKRNSLILVVCWFLSLFALGSCNNADLFDPEAYAQMLADSFPVKNIDPNQNWKTVSTVKANIAINGKAGEKYVLKIYDKNPIVDSTAILLAKDSVQNGTTWSGTIDHPLADSILYVTRIDANKRRVVQAASIVNNEISVTFGSQTATKTRALTRTDQYTVISEPSAPYSSDDINKLLSTSVALTSSNNYLSDGQVYEVKNYTGNITYWGSSITYVIVTGNWTLSADQIISDKLRVIVASGGSVTMNSHTFYGYSGGTLTVLSNGSVVGGNFNFSSGGTLYNGGTINGGTCTGYNGLSVYNASNATFTLSGSYNGSGCNFYNWGTASIGNYTQSSSGTLYTAGLFTVTNTLSVYNMYLGSYASLQTSYLTLNYGGSIYLNANSILSVTSSASLYGNIYGPTNGYDYAIFNPNYLTGSIYNSSINNDVYIDAPYSNYYYSAYVSLGGSASFVDPGCAPMSIPSTDQSIGYASQSYGNDSDSDTNFSVIYTFEDNYPQAGDYDFNDVVLKTERTRMNDYNVQLKVTLLAVGANQQNAAAIRLDGLKQSDISNVSRYDDGFVADWGSATNRVSIFTAPNNKGIDNACATSSKKEVVIPIFNDAHTALLGYTPTVSQRHVYNTVVSDPAIPTKSVTFVITTTTKSAADSITSDNLDVFISYYKNTVNKRIEVHTFPWKTNSTATGYIFAQEEAALSGKAIWAILVPSTFKYPVEFMGIENAYPYFQNWASNILTYQNWYNTNKSGSVY